ncbi:MAG: hypothetical protein CMF62_01795 [Magnetococcales bacterium]|nr:hypothetical protein [Magnetococcales bacterium]|tara:strand:+ start:86041 stop:87006 length:966 start_codon:yes stop_codon:yes gene_type:complete
MDSSLFNIFKYGIFDDFDYIVNSYEKNRLKINYDTINSSTDNQILYSEPKFNEINIYKNGDLVKILNLSIDYKPNLEIHGIRIKYDCIIIIDIPYTFIKTFYSDYIKIKKNKLIIDFSFIYNTFLLNFEYPLVALPFGNLRIELLGDNIDKYQISVNYTYFEYKNRYEIARTNFLKQINFLSRGYVESKSNNDSYIINFDKVEQSTGVFIKNINIDDIDSIHYKINKDIYLICEDITEFYNKCKAYENGIYISFGNKKDDFELKKFISFKKSDSNKLIIKMNKILSNITPEIFFICPYFIGVVHNLLRFPIENERQCDNII